MKRIILPLRPKTQTLKLSMNILEAFKRLEGFSESCFFFESLGPNKDQLSRYSILGFDPETQIVGFKDKLIFGKTTIKTQKPYETLRELMPQNAGGEEFAGGLVGYLSYEAVSLFEPQLKIKTNKNFNLFRFGLYTDGLVYDHLTGQLKYFYYKKSRIALILKLLKSEVRSQPPTRIVPTEATADKTKHSKMVAEALRQIKAGNIFQCEVGLRKKYKIKGSLVPVYEDLRNINPSPYLYYLKFDHQILLGSSPELLLSVDNGQMETFPLAGTIKRGTTLAEDQKLAKDLLNDQKQLAEHKMLVDLNRNDLGRVAKFGTVIIKKLMDIKKFSHVQHISSEISGLLRPDADMFEALKSCFPAGVVTGAPKIEAMKIINTQESEGRGPYGGAVGFFGFNGNCEFCLPIRSLFSSKGRGYLQACGGIVYDSKPKAEFEEVINKLKALEIVLERYK